MANGMAVKMPPMPKGKKNEFPLVGAMLKSKPKSSFPEKITARKKKARMPSASTLIATVKRIVATMPRTLMATKMM